MTAAVRYFFSMFLCGPLPENVEDVAREDIAACESNESDENESNTGENGRCGDFDSDRVGSMVALVSDDGCFWIHSVYW